MTPTMKFINILLFIIFCIIFYFLMNIEDEKTCNCINSNQLNFYHNFIKVSLGFIILSSIVFQDIIKLSLFTKQIFGIINILLFSCNVYLFMRYIIQLDKSKCKCIINHPLFNNILYISGFLPLILYIILCIILIYGQVFSKQTILWGYTLGLVLFLILSLQITPIIHK
jgi:hypothetical protein